MRTPTRSDKRQKGGAAKREVNKLRKKAMKSKMMKKTMLTLAGDDTKEDIRDLMNESDMSSISIIGRDSPVKPAPTARKGEKSKKTTKSAVDVDSPRRRSLRSQVSLKSLSSQLSLKRKQSNGETNGAMEVDKEVPKVKLVKREENEPVAAAQNGNHQPEAVSRIQGVKNLLNSAVWGVPYAQVGEEANDTLADTSQADKPSKCLIS